MKNLPELKKTIKIFINQPKIHHRRDIQEILPSFTEITCAREIQRVIISGINNKVPLLKQAQNLRRLIKHCPEIYIKSGIPLFAIMKRKVPYVYETKISFTLVGHAEIDFLMLKKLHIKKRVLGFDMWTTVVVNADNIDQAKERLEKYNRVFELQHELASNNRGIYYSKSYFLTMAASCLPSNLTWEIVSQF